MNIKAKMRCAFVQKTEYNQEIVQLNAVYGDGATENASFSKSTPTASLTMTIDNPDAQNVFVPGKEYLLDFKPAE